MKEPPETVRLDRWLMAARFYKTRSQAARACDGRKIKVNGLTSKPHKLLHIGDELTVHNRGRYRNVRVLGLAQRGLPPEAAQELYHEEMREVSQEERELVGLFRQAEKKHRPRFKGRPTKKERRELEKWKGH